MKKFVLILGVFLFTFCLYGCNGINESDLVGVWGTKIIYSDEVDEIDSEFSTLILKDDATFELHNYGSGIFGSLLSSDYSGIYDISKNTLILEYYSGDSHNEITFEVEEDRIFNGAYYDNGSLDHYIVEFVRLDNYIEQYVGHWVLESADIEGYFYNEDIYNNIQINDDMTYILYEENSEDPDVSGEVSLRFTNIVFDFTNYGYTFDYAYIEDGQLILTVIDYSDEQIFYYDLEQ